MNLKWFLISQADVIFHCDALSVSLILFVCDTVQCHDNFASLSNFFVCFVKDYIVSCMCDSQSCQAKYYTA